MLCRLMNITIRMDVFQVACIKMDGQRLPERLLTYMNVAAKINGTTKLGR